MEIYHPRSIAALLLIVAFMSSCCIHKNVTGCTHEKSTLAKNNKDSIPLSNDSLLTAIQNADSILLYRMVSPLQQDTLANSKMDSIVHYKINKELGKVNLPNTSIFNFLSQEEGILSKDYPITRQAFLPDYAIRLYRNEKIYILLFSLGTEELRIIAQDSTEATYRINKMRTFLHWFNLAIPNDNYIKSILRWK